MGAHQDIVVQNVDVKLQLTCQHPEKLITQHSLQIMFANHDLQPNNMQECQVVTYRFSTILIFKKKMIICMAKKLNKYAKIKVEGWVIARNIQRINYYFL